MATWFSYDISPTLRRRWRLFNNINWSNNNLVDMVDVKELRVGNWVDTELGFDQVEARHFAYVQLSEKINPITLTHEILEKCGFVKTGRYAIGVGGYEIWRFYREPKRLIELMEVEKGSGKYTLAFYEAEIKYLHQLQNLFFCLTGTELNYKL